MTYDNMIKVWSLAALMGLPMATGCDEAVEELDDDDIDFTPADDEVTFRSINDNGIEPNGLKMNGLKMNGFLFGLISELTASVSDLQFQSGSLLRAWHSGSGSWKVGAQLNGMTFNINTEVDGTPVEGQLKIVSVTQSTAPGQSDVYFYNIQNWNGSAWVSACYDGAGQPVEAIALQGNWDAATGTRTSDSGLTWACRGAALAKAVEWGWRPWVSTALKNLHQAAVRMIRADYCGNGTHHTTNGNPIDIQDHLGIQTFESSWNVEAGWGVNGAVCVDTPRKLYWPKNSLNPCSNLPACNVNPIATQGALLVTKALPNNN
jgi:hypothetical protein